MPNVLRLDSVAHHYGSTPVLDQVSLTVDDGELVSVLGRSGAGKTTLLRAIGGFITPTAGRISIMGNDVYRDGRTLVPSEKRGLGIVFQDYALFSHMTVAENVGFGLPKHSQHGGGVAELLKAVGMEEHAQKRPAQLSGGQQQRVALARALAPEPALLLLDEPFANLDAALRTELERELRRLLDHSQTAALMITHDRREALSIADRTVILEDGPRGGWIAQCAPPEVVYRTPATPEVARLTGDCTCLPVIGEGDYANSPLGDLPLSRPVHGPCTVLLRLDSFHLIQSQQGRGTIISRSFEGSQYRYRVRCGEVAFDQCTPSQQSMSVGATVDIEPTSSLHCWPQTQ